MLLSSHILAEVEKLCDRVTIIRQGRAVQTGTLDDLRVKTRTSISVATARPVEGLDALAVCTGSVPRISDCISRWTATTSKR